MRDRVPPKKIGFSFVVDQDPRFAYQGWHLAHSIIERLSVRPDNIFVQFTDGFDPSIREQFKLIGCRTVQIKSFGDGKFCNKIAQWSSALADSDRDHFVFLDTDTIFVTNGLSTLNSEAISAKVVDLPNPDIETFEEIMRVAGYAPPAKCLVDASDDYTYCGNCNGGMLSVPRAFADELFTSWRNWALWLLDNKGPLERAGKQTHIDQVSLCLAINETKLPLELLPSNMNYFVHFGGPHRYHEPNNPISLLHYHDVSINVAGMLEPPGAITAAEKEATQQANAQFARHFNNKLFWEMRYTHFRERGSGVGSRGDNLEYKRSLLRACGAEGATSVLDVGCGDLEVVKALGLRNYVGVDQSATTLEIAKRERPDWTFSQAPCPEAPASDLVLCFEVLIHQETASEYHALITYLAERTNRMLLVSGYEAESEAVRNNPIIFFHEPLSASLKRTGKFTSIKVVGRHTDVTIFQCVVPATGIRDGVRRLLRRGS